MRGLAGGAALLSVLASTWTTLALVTPAFVASAAENSAVQSIPVGDGTSVEIHATANCVPNDKCYFTTSANLMTPDGPTGFPPQFYAKQNTTLRSSDRMVYLETDFDAPNTRLFKSINDMELSTVYFDGGPPEKFVVHGDTLTDDWSTGRLKQDADYIVCSYIQVVYAGVNLTTPTACAQTRY